MPPGKNYNPLRARSVTQQENAFRQLEQENEDRRMAEQMANPGGGDGGGGGGGMMQPPQGMDGMAQDDFRPDTAAALQAVQAMESEGGFSPPSGDGDGGMGDSQLVSNQPYDEALMAATSEGRREQQRQQGRESHVRQLGRGQSEPVGQSGDVIHLQDWGRGGTHPSHPRAKPIKRRQTADGQYRQDAACIKNI